MGLLDEAIREHMELKRLRGADPGEVARQERDALGPVVRGEGREEAGAFGEREGELADDAGASADDEHRGYADEEDHPARESDFAHIGQETAELDMRAVLDGRLGEEEPEEEPALPGEAPGQERLWFDQRQSGERSFDFDP